MFIGILLMNSCNTDIFLLTAIICTLSTLNRELTQQDGWNTQDGWKTQDSGMTKRYRVRLGMHMQSRATFFRHSAVLSFPAVLSREVPNELN